MSNIIRLNKTAPKNQWIVMSNQGTDCFLELLILAADPLHQTEHQEALVSFLKDQKDINAIAPGTAGFDLDEMPWKEGTLKEDLDFLLRVTARAESESAFEGLSYEANRDIALPWLERFERLIRQRIMETERHIRICEDKMIIEIDADLKGSILDIGGGGEAVIGQIYGDRVTAIDNCLEELDEVPECCTKMLMDAEELSFPDDSFDNVVFFYSLMYMTEETQQSAICEASRVLKAGGTMHIWDCDIGSAFPDPFVVDLDIRSGDKSISTSYGIVKADAQSSDSIVRLLEQAGLSIVFLKENNEQFHIQCRKE